MELVSPYADFVYYIDDAKVEKFVRFVLTLVGLVMLIAPLWVLAVTRGRVKRLGVITAFVVMFLVVVGAATTARSFEGLAATAA
jgi:uncharacterized membrane protein